MKLRIPSDRPGRPGPHPGGPAERLEVSRQAVSKWEWGLCAHAGESENAGEILEVTFETAEGGEAPPSVPKPPFWNWKDSAPGLRSAGRIALFSIAMWTALNRKKMWTCPGTRSRT